jgi:hypothetical protein
MRSIGSGELEGAGGVAIDRTAIDRARQRQRGAGGAPETES